VSAATLSPALELAARARLLALGFTAPHMDTLGEMRNLAEALACGADGVEAEALSDLLGALGNPGVVAEAPSDFSTLFDREAPCAPYEGSYDGDPFRQVRQMSDVAGFYAAFGAEASGPDSDRPDHVACELEFLSFLALRGLASRMDGREEDVATCREAEESFLRDHLGRWLGAFCDRVARTTTSPLYASLGRLGSVFAASELGRRGIVPSPLSEPRRWSVEADELTCGASLGEAGGGCGGGCAGLPASPAPPDAA
jgi:TorA maturation chaperone TorD